MTAVSAILSTIGNDSEFCFITALLEVSNGALDSRKAGKKCRDTTMLRYGNIPKILFAIKVGSTEDVDRW